MANILNKFEKVSTKLLIALAFLLPVAFVPESIIGFEALKISLVVFVVLVASVFHIAYSLSQDSIALPTGKATRALWGLCAVAIVAGILSPIPWKSFIGNGFELYTVSTFLSIVALVLVTSVVFRRVSEQVYLLSALLGGVAISLIYTIVRFIFGADFISFNYFAALNQTPLGSIGEASVLVSILLIVVTYIAHIVKGVVPQTVLRIFQVLALIFLTASNSQFAWLITAIGIVLILIVRYVRLGSEKGIFARLRSVLSIAVAVIGIIAVIGIFAPNITASVIARHINLVENSIKPSWQASVDILAQSIKLQPLTGIGPNRFAQLYVLTRPANINTTVGWNIDFDHGASHIFTLITTYGLLMLVAVIAFSIWFTKSAREIFVLKNESVKGHVQTAVTIGACLGLVSIATSNSSILVVSATALFIGLMMAQQDGVAHSVMLMRDQGRKHLINISIAIIAIVLAVGFVLVNINNFRASMQLNAALVNLQQGKIDEAIEGAQRSTTANNLSDLYPRRKAEIIGVALQSLIQTTAQNGTSEKIDSVTAERLMNLISSGSSAAAEAVKRDPTNYLNTLAEIRIAEMGALLGVENAYEVLNAGYDRALSLNPVSASIYLNRSVVELTRGNYSTAKTYASNALFLKPDYVEAVMVLARISLAQNKTNEAIALVEKAVKDMSQNPRMAFELGALRYTLKDYAEALVAFEGVEKIVPQDATVQYYKGLTLARLGRRTDALAILSPLSSMNPQNSELALIVENLRAGKSALSGLEAPAAEKPQVDSKQKAR